MKTLLAILSVFTLLTSAYGQDSVDVKYVDIKWIPGTIRIITEETTTTFYEDEEVLFTSVTESNYKITVESLQDTVYEIKFQTGYVTRDTGLQTENQNLKELEKLSQSVFESLMEKAQTFEYSMLVDKNTGVAFKIVNEDAFQLFVTELIEEIIIATMDATGLKFTLEEYNEVKAKLKATMEEKSESILQTALNDFNFTTQVYTTPYNTKETLELETEVYDYNEIIYGEEAVDAILITNSSIKGNELTINCDYQFDQAQAYDLYIVKQGLADEYPIESFETKQHTSTTVNLTNSWIKTLIYDTEEKAGNTRTTVHSKVTLR